MYTKYQLKLKNKAAKKELIPESNSFFNFKIKYKDKYYETLFKKIINKDLSRFDYEYFRLT